VTRILNWALLGLLLLALLVGVATFDRSTWPSVVGDEATYLMAAESLVWDLDLTYDKGDFDRFVQHWGVQPEGLILQSHDGGMTLSYGKPFYYPIYLAPFVRLSPTRGPGIANVLLLALAAVAAARTLSRKLGDAAPSWVAVFVFASVTFANVFWVHADLFLMCLVTIALALAYAGGPPDRQRLTEIYSDVEGEDPGRFALRCLVVGGLLAVVILSRPFYASLLLPAALAVPRGRRGAGIAALLGGTLFVGLLLVGLNFWTYGEWTSYGGQRLGFYSYTGFPAVDIPAEQWPRLVAERGSGSWTAPDKRTPYDFEPRLTAYNLLYFLAGRNVGVLPYYLPVLLGLFAFRHERGRFSLLLAVALAMACFFYIRPFNFYGGGAALGNRYFLPLYPAFWFLAVRPRHPLLPLAVAALAGLALSPLWTEPRAFPRTEDGGYRHVSPLVRRTLPYETTQDHLKPSGQEDVIHHGLWIKPLGPEVGTAAGGDWLTAIRGATAELLIGSPRPLTGLELTFAPPGVTRLEVHGAAVDETLFAPSGLTTFDLTLGQPRARHRMWWTKDDVYLYRLGFDLPPSALNPQEKLRFRLRPEVGGEILP